MTVAEWTNILLVLVTLGYVFLNYQIRKEVSRQAASMEQQTVAMTRQAELIGLSALVAALAALHQGSGPSNTELEGLAVDLRKRVGNLV